jgi:glycosyltransferase involved in cell wall biosynthesis
LRKVFFIAGLYPPIANSGTQRSVKFANYLPEFGWEPIVVTVENPDGLASDGALLKEVNPGTRIERVPLGSEVLAKRIARALKFILPEERGAEGLSWRIRALWTIPDQWAFWRPTVIQRALEIYENEGFDCIYATGFPWTSFLIARELSCKTGVPYVLDFRDLWTDWNLSGSQIGWFKKALSKKMERKVLIDADAVIAVSETQRKILEKRAGKDTVYNFHTITNGFDLNDFKGLATAHKVSDKFRIVYTGVWKIGYSPELLYRAVEIIKINHPDVFDRLDLVCAGFSSKVGSYPTLKSILVEPGFLSHKNALELMVSADALFLPVADGDYAHGHIPGKLFEYLGTQRPILAVAPNGSEVEKIVAATKSGTVVEPGDIKALSRSIVDLVSRGSDNSFCFYGERIACFERRQLTSKLAYVFDSVLEG